MADATGVRKRIDYIDKPDGSVDAVLTITLPGGVTKRFVANTSPDEAQAVTGDIVGAELALLGPDVVGFNLFKSVGKLAKKVASSKVFALAAKGLAVAAPLLGPLAPAALGASAGLGVAAKLAKGSVAAAHGAKSVAAALTKSAIADARKLTKTPAGAKSLLADANKTRVNTEKVIEAQPEKKRAPAARSAPAAARSGSEADLLARARAGRVRSNSGAPVNASQLLAAHREGRVYWVN